MPKAEPMSQEFTAALRKNPAARTAFEKFPPSHQREWLKYIHEAKRPETAERRVQKVIKDLLEKSRAQAK